MINMEETMVDCMLCGEEVKLEETDICIYCGNRFCGDCEADMGKCVECVDEGS